jgi:hypothetical protein
MIPQPRLGEGYPANHGASKPKKPKKEEREKLWVSKMFHDVSMSK